MDWKKNTYVWLYKKLSKKTLKNLSQNTPEQPYSPNTLVSLKWLSRPISMSKIISILFAFLFGLGFLSFNSPHVGLWRLVPLILFLYYYVQFYTALHRPDFSSVRLPSLQNVLETGGGMLIQAFLLSIGSLLVITFYHTYKNGDHINVKSLMTLILYTTVNLIFCLYIITYILKKAEAFLTHLSLQEGKKAVQIPEPIVETPRSAASDSTPDIFTYLYVGFMFLIYLLILAITALGAAVFIYHTYQDQATLIRFLDKVSIMPWLHQIKLATVSNGSLTVDWERLRLYVGGGALIICLFVHFGLSSLFAKPSASNTPSYPPDETTHP